MHDTSASLLARIRTGDPAAWADFVPLYTPFLTDALRRLGLQPADADDAVQETFDVLLRTLPTFEYDPRKGKFRSYLRAVAANRAKEVHRRRGRPGVSDPRLDELADDASELSRLFDREHDRYVIARMLARVRPDFDPKTLTAFDLYVLQGQPPAEVAARLGIAVGMVYVARSRVIARIRQVLAGLVPEE